jgi:hypothetical protein
MNTETAWTGKPMSPDERKVFLAAMVREGRITAEQATAFEYREPPPAVREHARLLAAKLRFRREEDARAAAQ